MAGMTDPNDDDIMVKALAGYLETSLSTESLLRSLLAKTGHDDPDAPLEECLSDLVKDYLRLACR